MEKKLNGTRIFLSMNTMRGSRLRRSWLCTKTHQPSPMKITTRKDALRCPHVRKPARNRSASTTCTQSWWWCAPHHQP